MPTMQKRTERQVVRIALFHTTLPQPGRKPVGVEVAVHRLASELAKNEDDVTVFGLSLPPDDALYQHKRLFGGMQWLQRNRLARWLILPLLLNFVDFKRFDVLHLHGDDWFYFRRTLPTVRTLHGSALREAQSATSPKRKLGQYVIYPLEHLAAKLATIALAVGRDASAVSFFLKHLSNTSCLWFRMQNSIWRASSAQPTQT